MDLGEARPGTQAEPESQQKLVVGHLIPQLGLGPCLQGWLKGASWNPDVEEAEKEGPSPSLSKEMVSLTHAVLCLQAPRVKSGRFWGNGLCRPQGL